MAAGSNAAGKVEGANEEPADGLMVAAAAVAAAAAAVAVAAAAAAVVAAAVLSDWYRLGGDGFV